MLTQWWCGFNWPKTWRILGWIRFCHTGKQIEGCHLNQPKSLNIQAELGDTHVRSQCSGGWGRRIWGPEVKKSRNCGAMNGSSASKSMSILAVEVKVSSQMHHRVTKASQSFRFGEERPHLRHHGSHSFFSSRGWGWKDTRWWALVYSETSFSLSEIWGSFFW